MVLEEKKMCAHEQQYNTNGKVMYMALSSNCVPCFLELYTQMYAKNNIQIHQMKLFDKTIWKRGATRLHKVRQCFDLNPYCEKLGIDCESKIHSLKSSKEIPVNFVKSKKKVRFNSYICFPKYKGEGQSIYKQKIAYKKFCIQRSFRRTCNYLNFEGYCPQCDISFYHKNEYENHEHIGKVEWGEI